MISEERHKEILEEVSKLYVRLLFEEMITRAKAEIYEEYLNIEE